MSSEIIATFEVVGVTERDAASAVAELITAHLDASGITCAGPQAVGSGIRLVASSGRRRVPVFVGPAPPDGAEPQRWFASIGASMTPLAKVFGGKDDDVRARVSAAVREALTAAPGVGGLRWNDDDPDRPPPA